MHAVPVGRCLLASVGRPGSRAQALAEALPEDDSNRIPVLMSRALVDRMPELAELLQRWVPVEWESIRLVAAFAGASASGDRPAAQVLADHLGAEVLAPDGQLLAVPDGTLFVLGGSGRERQGAWWRFRPGRKPERDARRFPAPVWEQMLAAVKDPAIPGVVVEEIPAGLWVHRPGPVRASDLVFAIPVSATTLSLVCSRPGDEPLRRADVWRLIEALPQDLYQQMAVVPYGDRPVEDDRLGSVVSLAANRTLRVRTGISLLLDGSGSDVVAVGADGGPAWRPFAREMAWRPHAGARVLRWTPPADNLLPAGPAQMLLNKRWLVEVIEAGLWIREVDRTDSAMTIRGLPLESRHCTVVVGVHDRTAQPPWRTVNRFLRRLPGEAQERLRLVVPEVPSLQVVHAAASACVKVLDGGPVCLLTANGELVPWTAHGGREPHQAKVRQVREGNPAPGDGRGPFRRADGRADRRTDDRMDHRVDRRVDRRTDDRMERRVDGPAADRRWRTHWRQRSTDSAELARLMGFVSELRRLAALDERQGADDQHRLDETGPPEAGRLPSGWPGRSGPGAPPPARSPSADMPVPDQVVDHELEPTRAPFSAVGREAAPDGGMTRVADDGIERLRALAWHSAEPGSHQDEEA
jgi:hypothetical protein